MTQFPTTLPANTAVGRRGIGTGPSEAVPFADIGKAVVTTVALLPDATKNGGVRYMVSNANATTFWSIVAAGGSNTVPVTSDGVNWRIG